MSEDNYKDLMRFSKDIGISPDRLVEAFEIEKVFHKSILMETSRQRRKKMYEEVYTTVHKSYGKTEIDIDILPNPKDKLVRLFKKELHGKSILDVGCGAGYFLASVTKQLHNPVLVGIDVSIPEKSLCRKDIKFIKADIIEFNLNQKFDIIFADQVIEHIVPQDLQLFLESIKKSLNESGKFIMQLPNRLFGPSDVTRIKDYSYTGKIEAEGTHLNEATYTELLPILKKNGFYKFKTILPIPKLNYLVSKIRINPGVLKYVENNIILMKLIYKMKYKRRPLFKFDTIIICTLN